MEHVSDKLKVLECHARFCAARDQPPLQRWCFAVPARNPSIQFMLFLDLCSWLMSEVTGDATFFRGLDRVSRGKRPFERGARGASSAHRTVGVDKFDDPNTSVNKRGARAGHGKEERRAVPSRPNRERRGSLGGHRISTPVF